MQPSLSWASFSSSGEFTLRWSDCWNLALGLISAQWACTRHLACIFCMVTTATMQCHALYTYYLIQFPHNLMREVWFPHFTNKEIEAQGVDLLVKFTRMVRVELEIEGPALMTTMPCCRLSIILRIPSPTSSTWTLLFSLVFESLPWSWP